MKYFDGIRELDTVATAHSHLSKEILKQLENEHNETLVRAFIYDKLYDETKLELIRNFLSKKKKITEEERGKKGS